MALVDIQDPKKFLKDIRERFPNAQVASLRYYISGDRGYSVYDSEKRFLLVFYENYQQTAVVAAAILNYLKDGSAVITLNEELLITFLDFLTLHIGNLKRKKIRNFDQNKIKGINEQEIIWATNYLVVWLAKLLKKLTSCQISNLQNLEIVKRIIKREKLTCPMCGRAQLSLKSLSPRGVFVHCKICPVQYYANKEEVKN